MGAPVLRQEAKSIDNIDGRIVQMVDDMVPAMYQAEGIGLAAPQVGIQSGSSSTTSVKARRLL